MESPHKILGEGSFVKSLSRQQKGMGKAREEEEIEIVSIVEDGRCQKIRALVLLADSL